MKKLFKEIALTFTIVVAFVLLLSLFGLFAKMMTAKDDFVFYLGLCITLTTIITIAVKLDKLVCFIGNLYKKIK